MLVPGDPRGIRALPTGRRGAAGVTTCSSLAGCRGFDLCRLVVFRPIKMVTLWFFLPRGYQTWPGRQILTSLFLPQMIKL